MGEYFLIPFREGQDIIHRRTAPLVDRLIIIANYAEVRFRPCQEADQTLLNWIDVLVFINGKVGKALSDLLEKSSILLKMLNGNGHHGTEIEKSVFLELFFIFLKGSDEIGAPRDLFRWAHLLAGNIDTADESVQDPRYRHDAEWLMDSFRRKPFL